VWVLGMSHIALDDQLEAASGCDKLTVVHEVAQWQVV